MIQRDESAAKQHSSLLFRDGGGRSVGVALISKLNRMNPHEFAYNDDPLLYSANSSAAVDILVASKVQSKGHGWRQR